MKTTLKDLLRQQVKDDNIIIKNEEVRIRYP